MQMGSSVRMAQLNMKMKINASPGGFQVWRGRWSESWVPDLAQQTCHQAEAAQR